MSELRVLTPEKIARAIEMYRAGEPCALIARMAGASRAAVSYHIRKAGVPMRANPIAPGKPRRKRVSTSPILHSVCESCGVGFSHRDTPAQRCKMKTERRRFCSQRCAYDSLRRTGDPYEYRGYNVVRAPAGHGNMIGWRREHIILAEKALGRRLRAGEVVHHINGVKNDNRRQNLLICTRRYHSELHQRMSLLYQREKFGTPARQEAA